MSHSPEYAEPHDPVPEHLDVWRQSLQLPPYPGYPPHSARFTCSPDDTLEIEAAKKAMPDGPWQTNPDAVKPGFNEQCILRARGDKLDSDGLPIHPWFAAMASDPSIGVVGGKGTYWHWGPNYTADSVIFCDDHVLLVKRKDTGQWALPGGHVDPGESALFAGVREVEEETGVVLPEATEADIIYEGPVVDPRATAHAWPETTAVRRHIDGPLPELRNSEESEKVAWFPVAVALQDPTLFGSHSLFIRQVAEQL